MSHSPWSCVRGLISRVSFLCGDCLDFIIVPGGEDHPNDYSAEVHTQRDRQTPISAHNTNNDAVLPKPSSQSEWRRRALLVTTRKLTTKEERVKVKLLPLRPMRNLKGRLVFRTRFIIKLVGSDERMTCL